MSTTVQRGLIVLVLLVAVVLVVRSFNMPLPDIAPSNSSEIGGAAPPPLSPEDLGLPPEIVGLSPQSQERQPDPNANWVPVGEFTGTETAQTTTFQLNGNLARVRYQVESDLPFLALFFVPATQTQAGAFPDVVAANQTEGEVMVSKPAGSYYLTVQSLGGTWSVAVDEEEATEGTL